MKISLGSWAFTYGPYADHPVPLAATLHRIKELAYDGVELTGFAPHVTLESYSTEEARRSLVAQLADLGLGVSGYVPDLTTVNPTVEGNKQQYLDLFKRNIDLCAAIGSPVIRVDTVSAPGSIDEADYEAATDRVADVWRSAADFARQAGVRMAWEFEPGFAFNKLSELIEIHEKVGHPSFGLLLDTAHAYTCAVVAPRQHGKKETVKGGPAGLVKKLEGRIAHVHIIDSDGTLHGDETSTHCPFGEGMIDFQKLAPALLSVEGIEWWCIDLSFCAESWDVAGPGLEFVRRLISEHTAV